MPLDRVYREVQAAHPSPKVKIQSSIWQVFVPLISSGITLKLLDLTLITLPSLGFPLEVFH